MGLYLLGCSSDLGLGCSANLDKNKNDVVIYPVLRIRIRDPVPFYPKDPGSGSGIRDDFFSGSRILTTSLILDFTFKNGEKQEKLNFV
jgi:hypothetical protein